MRQLTLAAAVAFCALSGACAAPTAPTDRPGPPVATTPPPAPTPPRTCEFTAVSLPARVYVFDRGLSGAVHPYTAGSRYVLNANGTFELQYSTPCGAYPGTYGEVNSDISFFFAGFRDASGELTGDQLVVRYGLFMALSDFEDAVYRRTQ